MTEDELMDQWLRNAMTSEAPQLSSAFDAQVMARVRRRRLTPPAWRVFVKWLNSSHR
jgi:hypothetical protein